jgi:hypothetical protein
VEVAPAEAAPVVIEVKVSALVVIAEEKPVVSCQFHCASALLKPLDALAVWTLKLS